MLHDHSENARRVRTERHSNTELLRPLIYRKAHYAIKTDRRQNECDDSKNAEQARDDTRAVENFNVQSGRGTGEIRRQIRIQFGDRSAQSRAESVGALPRTRTNDDRAKLRGRRRAKEWHVKSGGLGLLIEWSLHQQIWNHTDNGAPRLRVARIENPDLVTERASIAPIFSRETRVHDRDRLLRIAVIDCKIAAFENLQAEGREIIVGNGFKVTTRAIAIG